MPLDSTDRRLLNLIQTDFPLTEKPYDELAQRLGTGFNEVIRRIRQLKETKIIRLIGPVIDTRRLGYRSTLVAMKVAGNGLEKAEEVIAGHPGVSHGYQREYEYNVWFTLALPPASDIEAEVQRLAAATGAEAAFSLPAVKMFKIGAFFDADENGRNTAPAYRTGTLAGAARLSRTDRLIINELQQDLPLVPAPFVAMAGNTGLTTEQFLSGCLSLQERGIIRRYSASINHRNGGFTANAMSCWTVPADSLDAAGQEIAALKEVSHCYERKTNPLWRYNLFAMIHGRSREICRELAGKVSRATGLADYAMLYSTREFKKTRVKYQV